jgi:ribulose-phosphate 3-epimerase
MKNHSLGASLLSIPPFELASKLNELIKCGIDFVHLDIMDANFVPNLAFNYETCQSIKALATAVPLDVHFMVTPRALKAILPSFFKLNASWMTFHIETLSSVEELFDECRRNGIQAGLAINPDTDLASLEPHLDQCRIVLLMSVPPGYGGQAFDENTFERIQRLSSLREKKNLDFLIEVDGGIKLAIAKQLKTLSADMIVIGSDLIKQSNKQRYIQDFHKTET